MAYPSVVNSGASNSGANTTSWAFSFGFTATAGNLLILCISNDGNSTLSSLTSPSGWSYYGEAVSGTAVRLNVWGKIADGTETGVTIGIGATQGLAATIHEWSGFNSIVDVEISTFATGTSTSPDPPSLNPTGWGTEDTAWMVCAAWDANVTASAYPTNYSGSQVTSVWNDAANGCGIATAVRANSQLASEDPGAFTIGSEDWVAVTIAIRTSQTGMKIIGKATGTNTISTVPVHASGDLFVIFAFHETNNTPATVPSEGWTTIDSAGANNCAFIACYKVADSTSEAIGTFTNAQNVLLHIYRGVNQTTPIGGYAKTSSGSSTTITYPTVTMTTGDGTSWVSGFVGHRSADVGVNTTPPSGMVNRTSGTQNGQRTAGHDTATGTASWTSTDASVGGTASAYHSLTVELQAQPVVTGTVAVTLGNVTSSASGTVTSASTSNGFLLSQHLSAPLADSLSFGG